MIRFRSFSFCPCPTLPMLCKGRRRRSHPRILTQRTDTTFCLASGTVKRGPGKSRSLQAILIKEECAVSQSRQHISIWARTRIFFFIYGRFFGLYSFRAARRRIDKLLPSHNMQSYGSLGSCHWCKPNRKTYNHTFFLSLHLISGSPTITEMLRRVKITENMCLYEHRRSWRW